jgi:threonylcarbamoyladenosine tRNA methylthiotransferase MtaB
VSVETVTFGCRLNTAESDALRLAAEAAGERNLVIVNSCAVTAEAVAQARQRIRRLKRDNPDRRIIVTGCAAQTEPETFARMPEVAAVVGNAIKEQPARWQQVAALTPGSIVPGGTAPVLVDDLAALRETAPHLADLPMADAMESRARAIVQVQNGCDHRCTFCIIPYGRGPSRSAAMGVIIERIARLVDGGAKEVVLTGVDLTSWGHDLPGAPRLGRLVRRILRHVPELKRLRLSSIDSIEADDDLLDALANETRFAPHLHLSLQAGDDMILKRMKRRHLRNDAIRFCETVRRLRPDIAFGADLIAGFPTEDEAMFARSLALVEECGLSYLHVFPFSPRAGTPAARMPQVAPALIRERAARLRAAGAERLRQHLAARVGKPIEVLTERGGMARAADFTPMRLAGERAAGEIHLLAAAAHDGQRLIEG